jgi:hypothetical protein
MANKTKQRKTTQQQQQQTPTTKSSRTKHSSNFKSILHSQCLETMVG